MAVRRFPIKMLSPWPCVRYERMAAHAPEPACDACRRRHMHQRCIMRTHMIVHHMESGCASKKQCYAGKRRDSRRQLRSGRRAADADVGPVGCLTRGRPRQALRSTAAAAEPLPVPPMRAEPPGRPQCASFLTESSGEFLIAPGLRARLERVQVFRCRMDVPEVADGSRQRVARPASHLI